MHANYISDELIHWTGRGNGKSDEEAFGIIKLILDENRLLLSNCQTTAKVAEITAEEQIVCFTDIPLELSGTHCSRFGKFGVAVDKNAFIKYGANPVLYYTSHINQLIQSVYSYRLHGMGKMDLDLFQLLGKLSTLFQSYGYRDDDGSDLNYYQREWRLSLDSQKGINHSSERNPKPGSYTLGAPGGGSYFNFSQQDIRFVVVPKTFEERAIQLLDRKYPAIDVKVFENVIS